MSGDVRPGTLCYFAAAALLFVAACGSPQALQEKAQGVEAIGEPKTNGRIAFVRLDDSLGSQNMDIYLMDAEGNAELRLTDHPAVEVEPAWSPDGQNLAFSSDRHGKPDYLQIYTMSAEGGRIQRVTTSFTEADSPSWSPDGARIAFRAFSEAGDEIYTVNPEGSDLVQVSDELDNGASGAYWPAWSPDGSRIVHKRIRYDPETQTDSEALYSMSPDGADVERLTPEFFFSGAPTWSPDGSKIAFAARRNGEETDSIYVMSADGSGLSAVMEDGADPSWSPDGAKIAFASARGGDSEIYVMSADGSEVNQLTNNDLQDFDPAWQPVPVVGRGSEEPSGKSASPSPSSEESPEQSNEYVGFRPPSELRNGKTVTPVTFVDGSRGDVVADPGLGVEGITAQVYTAGGLGEIDRDLNFRYEDGSSFMHEGPLRTYEGAEGSTVELWQPMPELYEGCNNLVYRFGDWFVSVRTCQDDLSESEQQAWAQSLSGSVTAEGWLVLSAAAPLVLEGAGFPGPEVILGPGRANWIELEPGECNPEDIPDEGDIRTMDDGTIVSFSRIEDGNSGIEYDWFAAWCEDGFMEIQVSYAYQSFAEAAAGGFRMEDIVLAE